MQLDRTRIAFVNGACSTRSTWRCSSFANSPAPLVACALLGILPLALINYVLIGWMTPTEYDSEVVGFRYLWNMTVLIFIEAPLAEVFIVAYLGPAVFLEDRTIRASRRRRAAAMVPLLLCQGLLARRAGRLGPVPADRSPGGQWLDRRLFNGRALRLVGRAARLSPVHQRNHPARKKPAVGRETAPSPSASAARTCIRPIRAICSFAGCGTAGITVLLAWVVLYAAYMLQGMLLSDWSVLHFRPNMADASTSIGSNCKSSIRCASGSSSCFWPSCGFSATSICGFGMKVGKSSC